MILILPLRLSLLFLLLLFSFTSYAQSLILAAEDEDSYPWTMANRTGVSYFLLYQVAENLGLELKVVTMPWGRCLKEMGYGRVAGCFSASYRSERLKYGRYPMKDGKLDPSRRLHNNSYSLYRLKSSSFSWDGESFSSQNGEIGAPAGYSVVSFLKEHQEMVYEAKSTEQLMHLLARGRLDGVAALTVQGDMVLSSDPNFYDLIEKVEPPLESKPYYLMFSNSWVDENPQLAETIWDEIAKVRESAEYQRYYQDFVRLRSLK